MNNDDDTQKLFKFITLYGLKPDTKDATKLTGTLLHCYPQPTPGNEPHTILSEFCFPDIESRTSLYHKEKHTQPTITTSATNTTRKSTPLTLKYQQTPGSSTTSSSSSSSSHNNSTGSSGSATPGSARARRVHQGVYLTTSTFDQAFAPRGSSGGGSGLGGGRVMSALPAEADIAALLLSKQEQRYYAYGRQVTLGRSGRSDTGEHYTYEQSFCVCVVTCHGWGACFREILGWMAVRLATLGWEGVVELAQALAAAGLPRHGMRSVVRVREQPLLPDSYGYVRPNELFKPASENARSLVAALGQTGITDLFAALVFERRVVLVSSDFDKLSRCVLTAYDMTWPFTWHYPCITVNI